MLRNLFGEMLDGFVESFPLLLSSNENEIQQVEDRFTAKAEEMFRPMADFFEANSPPTVS
jgi:hypothetical protein